MSVKSGALSVILEIASRMLSETKMALVVYLVDNVLLKRCKDKHR